MTRSDGTPPVRDETRVTPLAGGPRPGMVVDLFAGPGGWSEACRELGITEIGVEHDASACATRAAAGHLTIRQDVRTLGTARFRPLEGLIASPPCPTFSAAGNRAGIAELRYISEHVHACTYGWCEYVSPEALTDSVTGNPVKPDPRSALVLEPLRFALECVPTWIALEQVPDVLPVWEAYAYVLRAHAWSVWCGILNAADYGVPQTRRRAILMAHRRKEVSPPEPTHCEGGAQTLMGELLPWVSMASALGWTDPVAFALGERQAHGACRSVWEPAMTITGSADNGNFQWLVDRRTVSRGAGGSRVPTALVPTDQPAPSLCQADKWIVRGNNTVAGGPLAERELDEPAMTVGSRADLWTLTRPATTVQGDPRIAPPGHRDREGGEPQFGADALRLTETDALRLQSFRADYPVQGNKGQRFLQIGNAVPPLLARRILEHLSLAP